MSGRAGPTSVVSGRPPALARDWDDLHIETTDGDAGIRPLWTRSQLAGLGTALVVGLAVIGGSWFGSSGTRRPADQVRWVAVSLVGLALATLANVAWILRSRRAIGHELRALPSALGWLTAPSGPESEEPRDSCVTAAPSTLYHRPGCAFAAGRAMRTAPVEAHRAAGLQPCEVCQP